MVEFAAFIFLLLTAPWWVPILLSLAVSVLAMMALAAVLIGATWGIVSLGDLPKDAGAGIVFGALVLCAIGGALLWDIRKKAGMK